MSIAELHEYFLTKYNGKRTSLNVESIGLRYLSRLT